ncbi:RICIN domain-containing protein [Streptomyces brasiliscabiei]|uniref:RICIN domain-containing protein n=1 Tax=Streptomyces brasiliscabiei TaxID=2736302 RepID=UPI001C0FA81C|nr:RICIN domain-containing protein [Streptomyces brasiliscabiei]
MTRARDERPGGDGHEDHQDTGAPGARPDDGSDHQHADASDARLTTLLRADTPVAYTALRELRERHRPSVLAYARLCAASESSARELATQAFTMATKETARGVEPAVPWRHQLLLLTVRVAATWTADGHATGLAAALRPVLDAASPDGPVPPLLAAFQSLPPRPQGLIWYGVVEEEPDDRTAVLLGLTADDVTYKRESAVQALRQACLRARLAASDDPRCQDFRRLIEESVRPDTPRHSTDLQAHMEHCGHCAGAYEELCALRDSPRTTLAEGLLPWGGTAYTRGASAARSGASAWDGGGGYGGAGFAEPEAGARTGAGNAPQPPQPGQPWAGPGADSRTGGWAGAGIDTVSGPGVSFDVGAGAGAGAGGGSGDGSGMGMGVGMGGRPDSGSGADGDSGVSDGVGAGIGPGAGGSGTGGDSAGVGSGPGIDSGFGSGSAFVRGQGAEAGSRSDAFAGAEAWGASGDGPPGRAAEAGAAAGTSAVGIGGGADSWASAGADGMTAGAGNGNGIGAGEGPESGAPGGGWSPTRRLVLTSVALGVALAPLLAFLVFSGTVGSSDDNAGSVGTPATPPSGPVTPTAPASPTPSASPSESESPSKPPEKEKPTKSPSPTPSTSGPATPQLPYGPPLNGSYTQVVNVASGLCLDIRGELEKGTDVVTATCSSRATQRWRVDSERDALQSFADPDLCLDSRGATDDGVGIWDCDSLDGDNGKNLRFEFGPRGLISPAIGPGYAVTPDALGSVSFAEVSGRDGQRWRAGAGPVHT